MADMRRVLSEEYKRHLHDAGRRIRFQHGTGAAGEELRRPRRPKGDPMGLEHKRTLLVRGLRH
jgi:hypothetical protein